MSNPSGSHADLGPLPQVHPRVAVVTEARLELGRVADELLRRHGLTSAELVGVLAGCLTEFAARLTQIERRQSGGKPDPAP